MKGRVLEESKRIPPFWILISASERGVAYTGDFCTVDTMQIASIMRVFGRPVKRDVQQIPSECRDSLRSLEILQLSFHMTISGTFEMIELGWRIGNDKTADKNLREIAGSISILWVLE